MALHTILGANGTIARELTPVLQTNMEQIRLVSRNPKPFPGADLVVADLMDREAALQAVKGSDYVYLLVGLDYNTKVWQASWPVIMRNTIDACKAAGAKLIFFDNIYMYGLVKGKMTETTPYHPNSEKGKVRAEIDEMLIREMNERTIQALIAKAGDFYGPRATDKSAMGMMVFEKMKKNKTAQWLVNADQPHSLTFTPDAAKALYMLATTDSAYGQTWHLPTSAPARTGKEYIRIAAKYMHASDKVQVLPKWLIRIIGWFVPIMKELLEMSYQNQYPSELDSSKFEKAFPFKPTSYEEGISQTAAWYLAN